MPPIPHITPIQRDLLDAVQPFTVETSGSSTFVTTPHDLIMHLALIAYVKAFDTQAAGEKFNPHVTTGVAPRAYLDKMLKEPFATFAFSPPGLPSTSSASMEPPQSCSRSGTEMLANPLAGIVIDSADPISAVAARSRRSAAPTIGRGFSNAILSRRFR